MTLIARLDATERAFQSEVEHADLTNLDSILVGCNSYEEEEQAVQRVLAGRKKAVVRSAEVLKGWGRCNPTAN